MGLDAFVNCNCYKEGKTKPFPVPELEQFFYVDEEQWLDFHLDFDTYADVIYEIDTLEYQEYDAITFKVEAWQVDACQHRNLRLADIRIANWFGIQGFRQTLHEMGSLSFPTLAELPKFNGGFMTSQKAILALHELSIFRDLVDSETWVQTYQIKKTTLNTAKSLALVCEASIKTGNPIVWW